MILAPTIRSRFILLISLSVLFWFICSLVLMDRINQMISSDHSRREISQLRYDITLLNLETDKLFNHFSTFSAGSKDSVSNAKTEAICIRLISGLNDLNSGKLISENPLLKRNVKDAGDNVKEIEMITKEFVRLFSERGDLGTGLLKQWHTLLLSVQNISGGGAITGKATAFLDKVSTYAMNYLINRDPDELEKLIDFWQSDRMISIPANSAGFETETILAGFFDSTKSLSSLYRKTGSNSGTGLQAEIRFILLRLDALTLNLDKESGAWYEDFSKKLLNRFI
jgi:hypothetical protein